MSKTSRVGSRLGPVGECISQSRCDGIYHHALEAYHFLSDPTYTAKRVPQELVEGARDSEAAYDAEVAALGRLVPGPDSGGGRPRRQPGAARCNHIKKDKLRNSWSW